MALLEIQTALFAKLTGDSTLMSMVTGVFDEVPDGQAFPYVTIGETTANRFETFGRGGRDATVTIHIWSQSAGYKQALQILDQLNAILDFQPLTVTGYTAVYCRYENAQTFKDADGITRHVPARYRVVVQKD